IDFGASSQRAAILRPETGRVERVLFEGAPDFPSAIYLAKSGAVLVGNRAISYRGRNPLRLCTELKQHVNREAEGSSARRVLRLAGDELPLVAAMSADLGHAYAAIREQSGGPPAQVVLTHPVTWGGARKALLRKAAERAGIRSVLHLVSEPEAAVRHVLAHVPVNSPSPWRCSTSARRRPTWSCSHGRRTGGWFRCSRTGRRRAGTTSTPECSTMSPRGCPKGAADRSRSSGRSSPMRRGRSLGRPSMNSPN